MNDPRGSIWRKWDLHVHSPSSVLNNQYLGTNDGEKWTRFLEAVKSLRGISVLGVTDYLSIDGYKKLLQYRNINPQEFTNIELLLPNVELRILPVTDKRTPINLHVIFSPDEEIIGNLESQFFSNLTFDYGGSTYRCIRQDLINLGKSHSQNNRMDEYSAYKIGVEQFKTSLDQLKKAFKDNEKLRRNSLIIVSNSGADGASGIQHSSLAATRQEIYRFTDAIFSANPSDRNYFLGKGVDSPEQIIAKYGSFKPCIHGSDAHELTRICQPDLNRFTWIKADPTFEGLKQIIYAPEARVRIQETNPEHDYRKSFFSKVSFNAGPIFDKDKPQFSKNEISLNRDLVAIIGGRGTGKSLLLDAIKKTFQNRDYIMSNERYSYINDKLDFGICYTKEDGTDTIYNLPNINNLDYLHVQQGEVKKIVENPQLLDTEVKKLIGITETKFKTDIEDEKIQAIILTIISHKEWLDKLDALGKKVNDIDLQKEQKKKYEELIATITTEENKSLISEYRKNASLIDFLKERISSIDRLLEAFEKSSLELTQQIQRINELPPIVVNLNDDIKQFVKENAETFELSSVFIHAGDFDALIIKKEISEEQKNRLFELLEATFDQTVEDLYDVSSYSEIIEDICIKSKYLNSHISLFNFETQKYEANIIKKGSEEAIKTLEDLNAEIRRKFQAKNITEEVSTLLGKVDQYQAAIDNINNIIKSIESRKKSLLENWKNIFEVSQKLKTNWDSAKQTIDGKWKLLKDRGEQGQSPQRQLIDKLLADISITADVNFDKVIFYSMLKDCLDMRKFSSRDKEGITSEARMEKAFGVNSTETFLRFISNENVIDLEEGAKINLEQFMNRYDYFINVGQMKFLNVFFLQENIEKYIQVLTKSTYQGKEPSELSVGQRGTFYVCLKLATDTFGLPFVFDQPEDDLDNQFIMNKLVDIFREIKKYRQVIIVTHNANLCVNADAEQIIVATNTDEVLSYVLGALENPNIRESVYNILEGGKEAFLRREQKYNFTE